MVVSFVFKTTKVSGNFFKFHLISWLKRSLSQNLSQIPDLRLIKGQEYFTIFMARTGFNQERHRLLDTYWKNSYSLKNKQII